jgi:citrate lyase subunit beta-like protein
VLNYAAAYKLQAIDMISLELKNFESLEAECVEAAAMGFAGKQAIHPGQLEPIHYGFSPKVDELLEASKILTGFMQNDKQGIGVFSIF